MPASAPPVVCPFCPLHCDDVRVAADGAVDPDCPLAAEGFAAALGTAAARFGEQRFDPQHGSTEQLRRRAVAWIRGGDADALAGSPHPDLLARKADGEGTGGVHPTNPRLDRAAEGAPGDGLARVLAGAATAPAATVFTAGTDLASAKRLQALRDGGQIRLVVDTTPTEQAMATTVQRDGMVAATLGAVRAQADVIWTIGELSALPRLAQRLIDPARPALHLANPGGITAEETAELSDALRRADSSRLSGALVPVCETLLASEYIAVVLGTGAWPQRETTAAAVMFNRLLLWLTEQRRAVLVSLDAAATNRAVAAWRTNQTLEPFSDAPAHSGLRVRLGDPPRPEAAPVQLQIGGRDPGRQLAEAFLPAAVAGVHRRGAVLRGDGSVTLPLQQIAESPLPTAAQWLAMLLGGSGQ